MDAVECIAVVDLGTNSTRLLVANVADGRVEELERRTEITRLGEGVDSAGELSAAAMKRVLEAVGSFREDIDAHGATKVVGVATSAVRDAKNGEQFRTELADRFDVEVTTISGDEEARLSFLGATSGRAPGGDPLLVLDIGGGSTEFVVGVPGSDPTFHVSTGAGSVRQTERHLKDDPPTDDQLSALAGEVAAIIEAEVPRAGTPRSGCRHRRGGHRHVSSPRSTWRSTRTTRSASTATGSTATRWRRSSPTSPACRWPSGARSRGSIPTARRRSSAERIILAEAMRAFDFDWMETSEADILHGAALAPRQARLSSG